MKRLPKTLGLLGAVCILNACGEQGSQCLSGLDVTDAWARPIYPSHSMTSAYVDVRGCGSNPVTISHITSPDFGTIEMHRTELDSNGVSSMVEVSSIPVPNGQAVNMEPGGLHIMLMQPSSLMVGAEEFQMKLHLSDGKSLQFNVPFLYEGDRE